MYAIIFDTETTGLLPKKNTPLKNKPYIVQFSWIIYDLVNNNIHEICDHVIKLIDIMIPPEVSAIHGITDEIMFEKGEDMSVVLNKFITHLKQSFIVVAHNLKFDMAMLEIECERHNINLKSFKYKLHEYCTMKNSIDICNIYSTSRITGKPYKKYPKLTNLHDKLFGKSPVNIHNSLIDIFMCFRCYYFMVFNKDVMDIDKEFNVIYNTFCQF